MAPPGENSKMICATDTSNRPGTVRRLLDLRLFVGRQRVSVYRAPLHGETRTASLPATLSSFLSLPSFDENSWRQSAARGTHRQWRNSPRTSSTCSSDDVISSTCYRATADCCTLTLYGRFNDMFVCNWVSCLE